MTPPERLLSASKARNERKKSEAARDKRDQIRRKQQELHREMGELLESKVESIYHGNQHLIAFQSLLDEHCKEEKRSLASAEWLASEVDELGRGTRKIEKNRHKSGSESKFHKCSEKANRAIEHIGDATRWLAEATSTMLDCNASIVEFLETHTDVATLYAYYENHYAIDGPYSEATTRKELESLTANMVNLARQRQTEYMPVLESLQTHAAQIHEAARLHIDGGIVEPQHSDHMVKFCQMIEKETRELSENAVEVLANDEIHSDCSLHPLRNVPYVRQLRDLSKHYIHDHRWGGSWGP